MIKKRVKINFLIPIFIALFAIIINQFYGNRGIFPHDSTGHFDTGFRILLGDNPVEDYWVVSGFFLDYFQAGLFKLFGVNWQIYVLHASLLNSIFVLTFYFYFESLNVKKNLNIFFCICLCVLGYTSSGTPFVDHHSTLISILALVFFLRIRKNNKYYYFSFIPFLLLIAFLSKPVPAAYVTLLILSLLFIDFLIKRKTNKIISFFSGGIISLLIFLFFLKVEGISLDNFLTQYIYYSQEIGKSRLTNLRFDFLGVLDEFKLLLLSIIPLLVLLAKKFSEEGTKFLKKEEFFSLFSFFLLSIILIFYQLLTRNQTFIFFLIPILVCLSNELWNRKKTYFIIAILFTLFVTIKFHDRYNNHRKFHEMQTVDFSKSIDAKLIDNKLRGLKWITPQEKLDPKSELLEILKIKRYLLNEKEKYMLLTNYSFFSSILNKNNESFTRWFVGDGTDYPSKLNSKFQLVFKNLVIKKIKTKEIKKIYFIKPISEKSLKNLIGEKCLEKKNISKYLTQIKIICSLDSL